MEEVRDGVRMEEVSEGGRKSKRERDRVYMYICTYMYRFPHTCLLLGTSPLC